MKRNNLSQSDIDALFDASQSNRRAAAAVRKNVEKCDLSKSKTLSAEQLRVVHALHDTLARRLSDSLGAYLRVGFEMNLVSANQLTYGEFLSKASEKPYWASCHILPIDARALVQVDLSLVFPIVDLALGGSGGDVIDPREPTEIEEQIIETIIGMIARDLQITWAPVIALDIQFGQRQPATQVHGLMLPNERVLSLNFDVGILDRQGAINIAVPAVVANALLRKLSVQGAFVERLPSRSVRRRICDRLLDSHFVAELRLPASPLAVRELLNIKPGYVLTLPNRADKPVHLNIAGKPMFEAHPVRKGTKKGARIERRVPLVPVQGKETQ